MRRHLLVSAATLALLAATGSAWADEAAAQKWIDSEFQPSTLSKEDQLKEMQWFIEAAKPFAGMEVNVLSEGIPTHTYESTVLTKAFEEITGIKVNHQILGEGEVVQAVQTQAADRQTLVTPRNRVGLRLAHPLGQAVGVLVVAGVRFVQRQVVVTRRPAPGAADGVDRRGQADISRHE